MRDHKLLLLADHYASAAATGNQDKRRQARNMLRAALVGRPEFVVLVDRRDETPLTSDDFESTQTLYLKLLATMTELAHELHDYRGLPEAARYHVQMLHRMRTAIQDELASRTVELEPLDQDETDTDVVETRL